MRVFLAVLAAVLFLAVCASATSLGCRNPDGDLVDWWTMTKLPKISTSSNPNVANGDAYAYLDSTMHDTSYTLASGGLQDASGPLALTLGPVYKASESSTAWLFFNDEHPDGSTSSSTFAHQKGVLAFNDNGGFWLDHSIPRFPPYLKDGYSFPDNELKYGQSFICLSLSSSAFNAVGNALYRSRPWIYESNLPESFNVPSLAAVIAGDRNKTAGVDQIPIYTKAGSMFSVFAKNYEWDSNLYEDLVAPAFNSALLVESWMNGVGPLPSFCTPSYAYDVLNVRTLSMDGVSYKETQDHSKWAVTDGSSGVSAVCIGDINRQHGQLKRGGGTICFQNPTWHKVYNSMIVTHDEC